MSRNLIIVLTICIFMLMSCTPTADDSNGGVEDQQEATETATGIDETEDAPDDGTSNIISGPANPAEDAQTAMRSGDMEAAIAILESMSANIPPSVENSEMLIRAHLGYVNQISTSGYADQETLQTVMYHHYMRILALDGENTEALAGINAAGEWFAEQGIEPPTEIDPLIMLPLAEDETSESETEE